MAAIHLGSATAARFLEDVVDASRPAIDAAVVVVVAHPDDETLGCGALLPRLSDVRIVHVTDGAPRAGDDARRQGFATSDAYAAARRRELEAAMARAGIAPGRLACLGVPDQRAAEVLTMIVERLRPFVRAADVVLTHAFEGGHPDHDATAFATLAAAHVEGRRGCVLEMPIYRAGPDGTWIRQHFADESSARTLRLTEAERGRKAAMLAEHRSQAGTLEAFDASDEAFRPAQAQDFGTPPNEGAILFERFGWGVTFADFARAARVSAASLGLDGTCL